MITINTWAKTSRSERRELVAAKGAIWGWTTVHCTAPVVVRRLIVSGSLRESAPLLNDPRYRTRDGARAAARAHAAAVGRAWDPGSQALVPFVIYGPPGRRTIVDFGDEAEAA